jgi:hypothetical protein
VITGYSSQGNTSGRDTKSLPTRYKYTEAAAMEDESEDADVLALVDQVMGLEVGLCDRECEDDGCEPTGARQQPGRRTSGDGLSVDRFGHGHGFVPSTSV